MRQVRIFVSSPGDCAQERALLDEAVERINKSEMDRSGILLRTFAWEHDVVPHIGPPPQRVVDEQTPLCDIYVGIMSARFGGEGTRESGTEQEFRQALARFGDSGQPWILFYFNEQPELLAKKEGAAQEWARVLAFRAELETKGMVGTYAGARGSARGFFETIELHLRALLQRPEFRAPTSGHASHPAAPTAGQGTPGKPAGEPSRTIRWAVAISTVLVSLTFLLSLVSAFRLVSVPDIPGPAPTFAATPIAVNAADSQANRAVQAKILEIVPMLKQVSQANESVVDQAFTPNQEIIIDTSTGMGAVFPEGAGNGRSAVTTSNAQGRMTKLQAAVTALGGNLLPTMNHALRAYGTSCATHENRLVKRFGATVQEIHESAGGLEPVDSPDLISAILYAIQDVAPLQPRSATLRSARPCEWPRARNCA